MQMLTDVKEKILRYDAIRDSMRDAIVSGRVQSGLVVLEGSVAEIFGTSRAPVRKAFELLNQEGLLQRFSGRGFIVCPDRKPCEPVRAPLTEAALGMAGSDTKLDISPSSERIFKDIENTICTCIAFGHFRINESMAAEHHSVSRSAIREVLSRLRDKGVVEKSAYSRWLAGPMTARSVSEDYALRTILEPIALRGSALSLSRNTLEAMHADLEAAQTRPGNVTAERLYQIETALHTDVLSLMPNRKLIKAIEHSHMPLHINLAFNRAFDTVPESSTLLEHKCVVDNLLAGDVDAAANSLKYHLENAAARTLQRLKVFAVLPEPDLPSYLERIA
jgi:DNA-binding GntR family transcriptional regulator